MQKKGCIFFLYFLLLAGYAISQQPCTTLGQNPQTAFPVCGTTVFNQGTVPFCGDVPVPGPCVGSVLTDRNPFWYKFTCFTAGTLGFVITPIDPLEDYDWQLFDVTGRNPADVYIDPSLFVSSNWSGETNVPPFGNALGETGTGSNPVYPPYGCDGAGVYTFSQMPNLIAGRNYLLLVSHFSNTPNGYSLSFGGGTALITDPVVPQVLTATASCDGTEVYVKLNKPMKCSSLAANGSDFNINPPAGTIITGALGVGCNAAFDMDSIVISLNQPLPPGTYDLMVQTGIDGNTLLDNCDTEIQVGQTVTFTVANVLPTPMDSLTLPGCAPNSFELVFSTPIRCNSIATDGSDFLITGTYAPTIISASGIGCVNGLTDRITVQLSAPMQQQGNFQLNLRVGNDGNTLINDCGAASLAGQSLPFVLSDTVNADFSYSVNYGCHTATVNFIHPGNNSVNNWAWTFEDGTTSNLQNPQKIYSLFGTKQASLTVSNGFCSAGFVLNYLITDNSIDPQADFLLPVVCIADLPSQFTDQSTPAGSIASWAWNFGDPASGPQNNSNLQNPTHQFTAAGNYTISLTVMDATGCSANLQKPFTINGAIPISDYAVMNPNSLCANDSIAITNLSSVNPGLITRLEIYWDDINQPAVFEADNAPLPNKIYKHKYPNFQSPLTRLYNIRVRAYSGNLCFDDEVKTITLNAVPLVQFNAMPDVCYDAAAFQITQASETGGVPGTGIFSGPGVSVSGIFTPALAGIGTHLIKYLFTSTAAGCKDSLSRTITVRDTATAKFSVLSPICEGSPAFFTDESSFPTGSISNTTWDFGDGTNPVNHPPGSSFTHVYGAAGTYQVTLYCTTPEGCRSTPLTLPVVVSPAPVPYFVTDKADYCLPNAVVIFNSTSTIADGTESAFTYFWNFDEPSSGPNNSSVAKSPVHQFNATGPFNVSLRVRSGVGCERSIIIPLTTVHPQPKAAFSIDKPAVCLRDEIRFTDQSDPMDGTSNAWFWNLGDGNTRNTPTFTHIYSDTLTYPVTLYITNSFQCNSDTLTKPITVFAYPKADAGPDRFVLEGGSVLLNSASTGNNLKYLWTPPLYLNDSTIATPRCIDPKTDMNYLLTVTVPGGCQATDLVFVKLLRKPRIPNTFTPNNDGINDTWQIDHLKDYPGNRVQVFTRAGQLVFEQTGAYQPWNGTLKGKTLPADTYYYIIEPGQGQEPLTGYITIIK